MRRIEQAGSGNGRSSSSKRLNLELISRARVEPVTGLFALVRPRPTTRNIWQLLSAGLCWLCLQAAVGLDLSGTVQLDLQEIGGDTPPGMDYGGVWDGSQEVSALPTPTGHTLTATLSSAGNTEDITGLVATVTMPAGFTSLANTALVTIDGELAAFSVGTEVAGGTVSRPITITTPIPPDATVVVAIDCYPATGSTADPDLDQNLSWSWTGTGAIGGDPVNDDATTTTRVLRGTPAMGLQSDTETILAGGTTTFTATYENLGPGGSFTVQFTPDDLADLEFVDYVGASLPAGTLVMGDTLTFPYIAKDEAVSFQFTVRATGCDDLAIDLVSNDRYVRDTAGADAVVEGSVRLEFSEPLLTFNGGVPDLALQYDSFTDIDVSISNTRPGPAKAIQIITELDKFGIDADDIRFRNGDGAVWSYAGGTFSLIDATQTLVDSDGALTLSFSVRIPPADQCNPIGTQPVLWKLAYDNFCDKGYLTPVELGSLGFAGQPALSVSSTETSGKTIAQAGDTATFRLSLSGSNILAIDDQAGDEDITITIDRTGGVIITGATPINGGAVKSQNPTQVVWTVSKAELIATQPIEIDIATIIDGVGPCPGGTSVGVSIDADAESTVFAGDADEETCELDATDSAAILLVTNADDATDPSDFNFRVNGTPAVGDGWETGNHDLDNDDDQMRDAGEAEFVPWIAEFPLTDARDVGATWAAATYSIERASLSSQQLVGDIGWTLTGAQTGAGTIPGSDIDTSNADRIEVSLTSIAGAIGDADWDLGTTLTLTYDTSYNDRAQASSTVDQITTLRLTGLTGPGLCGMGLNQSDYTGVVALPLRRGQATVSLTALPQIADICAPYTLTLTVTNPSDFTVYELDIGPAAGNQWDITVDATSGLVDDGGGDFSLATLAPGASATATITVSLGLDGGGDIPDPIPALGFDLDYKSAQQVNAPMVGAGTPYTDSASRSPYALEGASLLVQISPAKQTIDRRELVSEVFITNASGGAARGIRITDLFPQDMGNPGFDQLVWSITDDDGNDISGSFAETSDPDFVRLDADDTVVLATGETLTLSMTNRLASGVSCVGLGTHSVSATWGCGNRSDAVQADQTFRLVDGAVRLDLAADELLAAGTPVVELCGQQQLYGLIRNLGRIELYGSSFALTLPTGVLFDDDGGSATAGAWFRTRNAETGALSAWQRDTSITVADNVVGSVLTITGDLTGSSLEQALAIISPTGNPTRRTDAIDAIEIRVAHIGDEAASGTTPTFSATVTSELPCDGDADASDNDSIDAELLEPAITVDGAYDNLEITGGTPSDPQYGGDGDRFEFVITVGNTGTATARKFRLRPLDTLFDPGRWNLATATITGPSGAITNPGLGVVIPLDDLPAGDVHTYTIGLGAVSDCTDLQTTSEVSWGCDDTHFEPSLTADDSSDPADLLLAPGPDPAAAVLHQTEAQAGGRVQITLSLSNGGGTLRDPVFTYTLPADFVIDSSFTAVVLPGDHSFASVTVGGTPTVPTFSLTGDLRGTEEVGIRFILVPTVVDTDPDTDPTPPGGTADLTVDYDDSCNDPGTSIVKTGLTVDSAFPDLDFGTFDPTHRLVQRGRTVTMTFLVVNDGEVGSTAENPVFTMQALGQGWKQAEYRLRQKGASGGEVTSAWTKIKEGDGVSLNDLPRYTSGSAADPSNHYAKVQIRGKATNVTQALTLDGRVSNVIRLDDGSDAGIGDQSLDDGAIVVLGMELANDIGSAGSSDPNSDDTQPRGDIYVGERIPYDHSLRIFGYDTAIDNVTGVSLISRYPGAATVLSTSSPPVPVDARPLVTWTYADITSGTNLFESESIELVVDEGRGAAAAGRRFNSLAEATATYRGFAFQKGVTGFPSTTDRRIRHIVREPVVDAVLELGPTPTGPWGGTITTDAGGVIYLRATFSNSSTNAHAYEPSLLLSFDDKLVPGAPDSLPPGDSWVPSGSDYLWTLSQPLDPASSAEAIVPVTVGADVELGEELMIAAGYTAYSQAQAASDHERTYAGSATVDAKVLVPVGELEGGIIADSEASTPFTNDDADVLIGEQISSTYQIELPAGVASNLRLRINIPPGTRTLLPVVTVGSAITTGIAPSWDVGFPFDTDATAQDIELAFDNEPFDDLDASTYTLIAPDPDLANRTITVSFIQLPRNIASIGVDGTDTLSRTTDLSTDGTATDDSHVATLSVVEPQATQSIDWRNLTAGDGDFVGPTIPDAGDLLEIRMRLSNPDLADGGTASDARMRLELPDGVDRSGLVVSAATLAGTDLLAGDPNALDPAGSGTTADSYRFGRGVAASPLHIPEGETLEIRVQVTVLGTILPATDLTLDADADWQSLTIADGNERSGDAAAPDPVDDYIATAQAAFSSADGVTISKNLADPTLTDGWRVGETFSGTITIADLPEGRLPMSVISEVLPTDAILLAYTISTTGDVTDTTIAQPNPGDTGTLQWDFDTIIVAPDNMPGDSLTIAYTAYVANSTATTGRRAEDPTVTYAYDNAAGATDQQTADDFVLGQPIIDLTSKSVLRPAGQVPAGGLILWELSARNAGSAPAYELVLLDALPAGADNAPLLLEASFDGVGAAATLDTSGGVRVRFPTDAPWKPGVELRVELSAFVDLAAMAPMSFVNQARSEDAWSLPLAHPDRARAKQYAQAAFIDAPAVELDNVPPDAPTITSITIDSGASNTDGITNDDQPSINGTVDNILIDEPITITVYVDSVLDGTVVAGLDGRWTYPLAAALADGTSTINATATDKTGNVSTLGNDYTVLVDTVDPTLTATGPNGPINDPSPDLTGTIDDTGSGIDRLVVLLGGETYNLGDGALSITGTTWTLSLSAVGDVLPDGNYTPTIACDDLAGNITVIVDAPDFTVDTVPPAVPTVVPLLTNSATPSIGGTSEPGTDLAITVTISATDYTYTSGDSGVSVNPLTGNWTVDYAAVAGFPGFPDGTYDVQVLSTDAAGNSTPDATTDELIVDLTPPGTPTIDRLVTNDAAAPDLLGSVEAGTVLAVDIHTPGGPYSLRSDTIGSALSVAGDGNWRLDWTAARANGQLPDVDVAVGTYQVDLISTDAADNDTSASIADALRIVDTLPIQAPGDFANAIGLLTNFSAVVLDGGSPDDNELTVTVGTTAYAVTPAGGSWSLDLGALADGFYPVTVRQTSDGDTVRWLVGLAVDRVGVVTPPADFPTLDGPKLTTLTAPDLAGDGRIGATLDLRVFPTGSGTLDQTASPVVAGDGSWSVSLVDVAADGVYDVTVLDAIGLSGLEIEVEAALRVDSDGTLDPVADFPTISVPRYTNDQTPEVTGTAVGDPVRVSVDFGALQTVPLIGGNWTYSPSNTLAEGAYGFRAIGGNGYITELFPAFTVDITPPAVPTVDQVLDNTGIPILTGTSDIIEDLDGDSTGHVTMAITFGGTTYTFDSRDGKALSLDESTGAWDFDTAEAVADGDLPAGGIPEGVYDIDVTAFDLAGNSATNADPDGDGTPITGRADLIVDLTDPVISVIDRITPNDQPLLGGGASDNLSGIADIEIEIRRTSDNALQGSYDLADLGLFYFSGADFWLLFLSLPPALSLPDDDYTVIARATDRAGNTSADVTGGLTVDSDAPNVRIDDIPIITNDTQPTIEGVATDNVGVVALSVRIVGPNKSTVVDETFELGDPGLTYDGSSDWALDLSALSPLPEGVYEIEVEGRDAAGNTGNDPSTNELTIDTTPPVVTATDLTTNNTLPTLQGTLDDASADLTVTLTPSVGSPLVFTLNDGFLSLAGGVGPAWILDLSTFDSPLAEDTYAVSAAATDPAGNVGNASATLIIDTTAPPVTADDLRTNNQSPTITGTVEAGATLTVIVAGQTFTEADAALSISGSNWSLDFAIAGLVLPEAIYPVLAEAEDTAGNTNSATATLDVDITPPPVPTVADLITNNARPTLTGTYTDTTDLTLFRVTVDGRNFTDPTAGLSLDAGAGTWSLDLGAVTGASDLGDGVYDVTVTVADDLGNSNTDATSDELTVDTTPPANPTVDSLITNEQRPTITGGSEASTVLVVAIPSEGLSYRSDVVDSPLSADPTTGDWELDLSKDASLAAYLDDGVYDVDVTSTDAAGNSSSDTTTNELTVDTTPPTASVNDLITNDTTPIISGIATDNLTRIVSLDIEIDGRSYNWPSDPQVSFDPISSGVFELDLDGETPLADGVYEITVTPVDQAGNIGGDMTSLEVVIDTEAPGITVQRQFTQNRQPVIRGTVDLDAEYVVIGVNVMGTDYIYDTDDFVVVTGPVWSLDLAAAAGFPVLADGFYEIEAAAVDAALNVGFDGTSLELKIDDVPPVVTVDDQTTNNPNPIITGTVDEPVSELIIEFDGRRYELGVDAALTLENGIGPGWSLDLTDETRLPAGTYTVQATAIDLAHNEGTGSGTLVIDDVPPAVDDLILRLAGEVGQNVERIETMGQTIRPTGNRFEFDVPVPAGTAEIEVIFIGKQGQRETRIITVGTVPIGGG